MRVVDDLFASVLQPTAITVTNVLGGLAPGAHALAVATEGFAETVDRHLRDIEVMAQAAGMYVEVLRGRPHEALWAGLRDFPADGEAMIRLTVPLASVEAALHAIDNLPDAPAWVAHAASGAIFIRTPAGSVVPTFATFTEVAQAHRGHVVLMAGPPSAKQGRDVWGPPPPALALMREIKRQFDPDNLLNPGRFVAFL
jgi:glycolate oxidase FAD binding subunit